MIRVNDGVKNHKCGVSVTVMRKQLLCPKGSAVIRVDDGAKSHKCGVIIIALRFGGKQRRWACHAFSRIANGVGGITLTQRPHQGAVDLINGLDRALLRRQHASTRLETT